VERARATPGLLPAEARTRSFDEVELALGRQEALSEAARCLRCDFKPPEDE
jgi:NADPH-dependent glutamate synthase beta subunit-like oxidoreductase